MSTKPDTETGWTKEFPTEDGYYWMRFAPDDRCPTPVRYDNGWLHEIGVAEDMRWARDNENLEFLGPISPSDFEQLLRLRKACEVVDQWFNDHFTEIPCTIPIGPVTAALREALAHTGEQS